MKNITVELEDDVYEDYAVSVGAEAAPTPELKQEYVEEALEREIARQVTRVRKNRLVEVAYSEAQAEEALLSERMRAKREAGRGLPAGLNAE